MLKIGKNHEAFQFCTQSEVFTITECPEKFKLYQYISNTCKKTDHSLVMSHITCSFTANLFDNNNDIQPRNNRRTIPNAFMSSQVWKKSFAQLIQHFETWIISQSDIDSSYQTFFSFS